MKKIATIAVVCLLGIFGLFAAGCGSDEPVNPGDGMANPVVECDHDTMVQATGIDLDAPEGATNVSYSYIEIEEDASIAQVIFTAADGVEYTYRAQFSSTGIEPTDISGMNYSWTDQVSTSVDYVDATAYLCDEASMVMWFDVVPGIDYSLSASQKVEIAQLLAVAVDAFVPAQGDA